MHEGPRPALPRLRLLPLLAWLAAGLALGAALAWLSLQFQKVGIAPLGLFSIALGAALGAGLAALAGGLRIAHRPALLAGAILLALATAAGQHVFAYLDYRAAFDEALRSDPRLALFGQDNKEMAPRTFAEYMRPADNPNALWHWVLDASLITAAATLAVAWAATRRPFCGTCDQWYRTIRHGPLDAATAHQVAADCQLPLDAHAHDIHFQLRACPTGCGPPQLLLTWTAGGTPSTRTRWLDADQAKLIPALLEPPRA